MAKVTIELRNCLKIDEFDLFDFVYPIEDEVWKEELEAAIIDYFYFHEIGQETLDRFKHVFRSRLRLIMPYYNELFKSKMMVLDPLLTVHLTEQLSDVTNVVSSAGSDSKTTYVEYPEHADISSDIPANKSAGESTSSQDSAATHNYDKILKGYTGVNVNELLIAYRKTIININQMIIDDLKQCFILIY